MTLKKLSFYERGAEKLKINIMCIVYCLSNLINNACRVETAKSN